MPLFAVVNCGTMRCCDFGKKRWLNEWYGVTHRNIQNELYDNFRNEKRRLFSYLICRETRTTNVKCEITDKEHWPDAERLYLYYWYPVESKVLVTIRVSVSRCVMLVVSLRGVNHRTEHESLASPFLKAFNVLVLCFHELVHFSASSHSLLRSRLFAPHFASNDALKNSQYQ